MVDEFEEKRKEKLEKEKVEKEEKKKEEKQKKVPVYELYELPLKKNKSRPAPKTGNRIVKMLDEDKEIESKKIFFFKNFLGKFK